MTDFNEWKPELYDPIAGQNTLRGKIAEYQAALSAQKLRDQKEIVGVLDIPPFKLFLFADRWLCLVPMSFNGEDREYLAQTLRRWTGIANGIIVICSDVESASYLPLSQSEDFRRAVLTVMSEATKGV